jgi:hypothetical protein
LLRRARRLFPFIERIFADGGYAGRKMAMTVWRTGADKIIAAVRRGHQALDSIRVLICGRPAKCKRFLKKIGT